MTEPHQRKMVECSQRPVQTCPEALEGKAAAFWTSGTYGGVCEHGQGATGLSEAAPAKAANAAGGLFQHSPHEKNLD